jgi:hypothetical protein
MQDGLVSERIRVVLSAAPALLLVDGDPRSPSTSIRCGAAARVFSAVPRGKVSGSFIKKGVSVFWSLISFPLYKGGPKYARAF